MLIALCVTCVSTRIFHEHNMDGGNFKQFLARRKRKNELFNEEVEEQFYKKNNRNDDEDDINGVMMAVAGVASTCVQKERKDRGPKILRDKTWWTYGYNNWDFLSANISKANAKQFSSLLKIIENCSNSSSVHFLLRLNLT